MGKLTKVFASGSIGNVIFYERLGTPCARSMPSAVRQTPATKVAASIFGQAKSISRELRGGLGNVTLNPKARSVMYITDKVVATWLRDGVPQVTGPLTQPLSAFELNPKTSVHQKFRQPIGINWSPVGQALISIPSFNPLQSIVAPAHTVSVRLMLAITCSTLQGTYLQGSNTVIDIKYNSGIIPAKEIQLTFEASKQSIYLFVAALRYNIKNKRSPEAVTNDVWLPVTVMSGYFIN